MELFKKACRIWNNEAHGENIYVDFIAKFGAADSVRIACDGNYVLCINGAFVDCGQYPGYEDLTFCDLIDIRQYAQEENELLITAHHPGLDTSTNRDKPPFVIFEVYKDEKIVYASDEETETRINPHYESGTEVGMVSGQLGFTFGYNAQCISSKCIKALEISGTTNYFIRPIEKLVINDEITSKLINIGSFSDRMTDGTPAEKMSAAALTSEFLCGGKSLPDSDGVRLTRSFGDGIFALIDLGAENAGLLSIDIEVPRECDIYIGWGEHTADLRVRTSIGTRSFAARYHAVAGRNRFFNPLLRCGLRYVQLHVYADECRIFYAGIRPTPYPLPMPKSCPIDDCLHRMIYETCVRTLELCMHEHYEDCPWREQALYTMDSRNQMLCGYYVFSETKFCAASLRLIAHSLRADGLIELCSPARVDITIPSFSAMFIVQLHEYLVHSDDRKTVEELLPTALAIAEMFEKRLENGLIRCFAEERYWNFYEWQDGLSESRKNPFAKNGELSFDAPLLAFVSLAFDALAQIQRRLGMDFGHFDELHEQVNAAAEIFWSEEQGAYASYLVEGEKYHYCELTNALLACCGAVPGERLDKVFEKLMDDSLIPITLSHSIFKYDALLIERENIPYILKDIENKWGYMLKNGATSFWETIEGEAAFSNAGSLCHGWSAVPAYIYFRIANEM